MPENVEGTGGQLPYDVAKSLQQSPPPNRARVIRTHHDGHGLAERLIVVADQPDVSGASHTYRVFYRDENEDESVVAEIQFQKGPRGELNSTPGIIDSVLLAIVADRMASFRAGPFNSRMNELVQTKCEEAMHWLRHRADKRAARGVLGKAEK